MRAPKAALAIGLPALLAGCAASPPPHIEQSENQAVVFTHASGLKVADSRVGTGPFPKTGQTCVVHYTGWLYQNGRKGTKFDSSVDRGKPFEFPLGRGAVIRGWDEGVAGMRVGGKRTLIVPPDLAYGAAGNNGIPPYSTLLFEVELLAVKG